MLDKNYNYFIEKKQDKKLFYKQVRSTLAQLGYEKLDDIIGHTELLRPRDISLVKTQHLDLGYVLSVCNIWICYDFLDVQLCQNIIFYFYFYFSECWLPKME